VVPMRVGQTHMTGATTVAGKTRMEADTITGEAGAIPSSERCFPAGVRAARLGRRCIGRRVADPRGTPVDQNLIRRLSPRVHSSLSRLA
jgi:hypothetical protein